MDEYTQLVRQTVETYARSGKIIAVPENLPAEFYNCQKGAFVTIYKTENGGKCLRGCVGTFMPTAKNIAEEIIHSAICASQEDNRFHPIAAEELNRLEYEVSLLNPPEQIYSPEDLNPGKYGIILRTEDGRCGLLLPDIKDIDSARAQIRIAAQKGCIDLDHEEFFLFRFTVEKHKE